ncbi:hypothetical protein [Ottowia thiooxydans]|uniref:F0F1-type ATP synthase assembly protein I n=1 Tax=Ottowia thiooxydans TaxID=219182 RepID=A0ABV2Q4X5_9BURK
MIETYFNAERAEGLLFAFIGAAAIVIAIWGWRQGAFWRGAAWPLVVVALIQISVGVSVGLRSAKDSQRVQHIVEQEPARIASEEIPRMQAVMKSFATNRWIEIGFLIIGLLVAMFASRGGTMQGAGAGLAVQAGLVLLLDLFAERRGHTYLEWLRTL